MAPEAIVSRGVIPGFDFDPGADLAQSPAWFLDATHSVPPWTPLFGWFWVNLCRHGMQYGAEKLSLPTVKGWDWRFRSGGGYLTLLLVKTEEERRAREQRFRAAIRPFIDDYDGLWRGFVEEMLGHYDGLKRLDLERATQLELLDNFERSIDVCRRMWEVHMYMMYGTFTAYVLFENVCRELLGIDDTSPLFHSLVTGFDNKVLQVDRKLWELSRRAQGLGLGEIFLGTEPAGLAAALDADAQGREFMREFRAFLDEDGWRVQRMEISVPTWIEDPTPALTTVKQFLAKGDFNLDAERERLTRGRRKAEEEVLAKLAPEQRGWFATLMRLAQRSGVFSEEHDYYLDFYAHALVRRSCLALGRRFAAAGALGAADDVFFLIPDEIRRAGINPDHSDLRPIAARRRAEWEAWSRTPAPPVLLREGVDIDEAMALLVRSNDPIALKVVVGAMPVARPELRADLHGTCGSPGVAEGTARVILDERQLAEVQPGDILVAATTSPAWTAVFSFVRGVVVDRGASLSHAAIVGREYGIPVLMNVFEGTQRLRSGQRIRVDANMGALYVLDG
jgi:phosphohistidine swiveling domain-containing protein